MTTKVTYKTDKIKIELNTKDNCRVCMFKQIEMSYIFEESCDIIEKIEYCTGLKIAKDDGLPSHICKNCMQDLATAYKFKSSCLLAYETYQILLKTEIKTEIEYEDGCGLKDNNDFVWDDAAKIEPVKLEENINAEGNCLKKTLKNSSKSSRRPYKKKPKDPDAIKLRKKQVKSRIWCAECNIDFKTKLEREEHMKCSHNSEPETWICEHCGKIFNKKSSMYSHALLHLPPRFSCDQCDYKTTYKHDLTKHKHVHSGIKRIQCQMCAARFRTTSNLWMHIRRDHEKSFQKRFLCEFCDKGFHDRTKYMRHVDTHNNVKRYQCEICNSAFTRRCHWKKHRLQKHNILAPRQRPGKQKAFTSEGNTTQMAVM